ncbi:MAG: PQQ-binding-like beta-propeller repeat protein [candidate division WOR-3 bacterium]|nr:PQQ-binding-like beta-propeller repeat protein [candidate division WOR-3 bacterium]
MSLAISCGTTTPRLQAADESGHNQTTVLPAGSIVLPDSLGGLAEPSRIALNPTNNRVYVCGVGLGVVVIDAATGKRVDIIPASNAGEMQYNPIANVLYVWGGHGESYELTTVDCTTDTVVARESLTLWPTCVNLRDNKLYAAMGKEHTSAVAVLDGYTRRLVATVGSAQLSKGAIGWEAIVWNPANDRVYYSDGGGAIVAIDGRTDREVARIPNSAALQPRCANPRNNKIYASSPRNPDSSLAVIDCGTNRIVAWLPVNVNIADVVYNPVENKVYCSGGGGLYGGMPSVAVIDGKDDAIVERVNFRSPPGELCYDSLNARVYCLASHGGWIAAIDCRRDSVVTTIRTDAHRAVFSTRGDRLFCLDWSQGDVNVVDGATLRVIDTLTLGYRVESMLYNRQQDKLYCANDGGHALAVIDCGTGRVRSTIEVGRKPRALACSPDGERLYCANEADGTVSVIDCESDQVVGSIKTGGEPTSLCLSPPNHRLFCAANSGGYGEKSTISVIDYRTDSVVSRLVAGKYPTVIYDSVNDRVFCASRTDRQWNQPIVRISAFEANSLSRSFSVEFQGGYLVDMCYDPILDRMYVARTEPDEVSAIDCKTGITRWVMRTAGQPSKLLCSPRQHRLYVASIEWTPGKSNQENDNSGLLVRRTAAGTVEVVDPNAGSSIARIEVAAEPRDLLYVPEVDRIYCACASSDTVVVIDCATNRIVDRKPVGARPAALAYSPKHGVVYVANSAASSISYIRDASVSEPKH